MPWAPYYDLLLLFHSSSMHVFFRLLLKLHLNLFCVYVMHVHAPADEGEGRGGGASVCMGRLEANSQESVL